MTKKRKKPKRRNKNNPCSYKSGRPSHMMFPVDKVMKAVMSGKTQQETIDFMADVRHEDLIRAQLLDSQAQYAKIFRIDDTELMDAIVNTDVNKFYVTMYRPPYDSMFVELPYAAKIDVGKKILDINVIQFLRFGSSFEALLIAFWNSKKPRLYNVVNFSPTRHAQDDDMFEIPCSGPHTKQWMSLSIKILAYLTSSNIEYVENTRNGGSKRNLRKLVPYMTTKMKTGNRKVTKPENTGLGTRHSYRYPVRGHYKFFKKKFKNDGTLIYDDHHRWSPPHFRGPEFATQVDRGYSVELEN